MLEITTSNGQFYYNLFYLLAIVFAGIFFMIDGIRKKYPIAEWSLIFFSGVIFLIIGTKLLSYTPDDWKQVFGSFTFPYTERKTVLGGIVFGVIGIWIAKKLIHFPYPILDSLAVSFPVAMAIQRIGCFMCGCCYGTPTSIPWSVSYSDHAMPFYNHLAYGLVSDSSHMSAHVHPNQLYQTVLCLLIAFVVWRLRNVWKRPGNLFFISITFYFIARFIVEFWRDSASNGIAGAEWFGLKYVQWSMLFAILIMITFILIRENKYKVRTFEKRTLINPIWYFILLSLFALLIRNWFTKAEFLFVEIIIIPVTFLHLDKLLNNGKEYIRYRLVWVYSLLFVLIISSTVTGQQSYNELTSDKSSRNTFNDISFGYGNYQYSHYHASPIWNGCSGRWSGFSPVGSEYYHNSDAIGIGLSHTRTEGKFRKLKLNLEMSGGIDTDLDTIPKNAINIFDLAPSFKYDFRWFGLSLGVRYGNSISENQISHIYYTINHKATDYINFIGSVRLFPYDICYAELSAVDMFPYQVGHRAGESVQIKIGSCFGSKDGSALEIGLNTFNEIPFISGRLFYKNKYQFRALVLIPKKYHETMFQFSISYRFLLKHWDKQPN